MKPTVGTYTAVLPWYERADFQRIWELAHDRDDMPRDYEVWYASDLEVMNTWLARGRALQIVTIRPDEFLVWLNERGLPNTAATRLRFVEDKARGGGASMAGLAAVGELEGKQSTQANCPCYEATSLKASAPKGLDYIRRPIARRPRHPSIGKFS